MNTDNTNTNQPTQVTDDDLKNLTGDELVELYVEQMLRDKGVEDNDGAKAQELKTQLVEDINTAILDELPDDKFEELKKRLDENGDLDAIIDEAGIDTAEVATRVMKEFRAKFLGEEA